MHRNGSIASGLHAHPDDEDLRPHRYRLDQRLDHPGHPDAFEDHRACRYCRSARAPTARCAGTAPQRAPAGMRIFRRRIDHHIGAERLGRGAAPE